MAWGRGSGVGPVVASRRQRGIADQGLVDAAADLLLGGRCPGCGRARWRLCEPCRRQLDAGVVARVHRDPSPPDFPTTITAGEYAGVLARALTAYKEEQVHSLAGPLGERLALAIGVLLHEVDPPPGLVALVPMPSAPASVRRRGLDCTAHLTRCAAGRLHRLTGLRLPVARVLRHRRRVRDQAGLDSEQRRDNLAGALGVRPRASGLAAVVLVDDVTTTGATLAEAARTVDRAGVRVLGAATLAATTRRIPQT